MSDITVVSNVPSLPIDPLFEVDLQGQKVPVHLTAIGKNFFEQLINYFFTNFSNEGLVAPSQDTASIDIIISNTNISDQFTAGFGRMFYNTNGSMQVTVDNGSGVPIIKTFTIT